MEIINYISVSPDKDRFFVGTTTGYKIFSTTTQEKLSSHRFGFPIDIIEQCSTKKSLLGLVGNANEGKYPGWSNGTLAIWDDEKKAVVMRADYKSPILNIKFANSRVFVVFATCILTLAICTDSLEEVSSVDIENPYGALAVASGPDVLAVFPSRITGAVKIQLEHRSIPKTFRVTGPFRVHESSIAHLAISQDGRIAVSASGKGTLLRIFETANGTLIKEVRRGSTQAHIHSICVSSNNEMIAATSNRGTCHIFWTKRDNVHSKLPDFVPNFMGDALPEYFGSEWSSSQLPVSAEKSVTYFCEDDTLLVVISADGTFTRIRVATHEGNHVSLTLKESIKFFP